MRAERETFCPLAWRKNGCWQLRRRTSCAKRVKGLAEQRDLAELEVRRLEANLESQTNHLNNLELRIADYDQGPVLRTRSARLKAVVVVVENELVVILSKLRLYVKSWLRNN